MIIYRKLKEEETVEALVLVLKVFLEFEAPEYPPEGTEEFRRCLHDKSYLDGIVYYGAFDGDILAGVVGIRETNCHICYFFVDSRYQRKGIGTGIFNAMYEDFSGRTITLNSSPYGVPFYLSLGFVATDCEQTLNGIRFTPMVLKGESERFTIVRLSERRDLKEKAAEWFSGKWSVPKDAYLESIEESFDSAVPSWYLCLDCGKIAGGLGVIENDFHERKDLRPNVCAVYTEEEYRNKGVAGLLLRRVCDDMKENGINTLYLLTDHTGFYERYGWEFFCMVLSDGEDTPSRMYIHRG